MAKDTGTNVARVLALSVLSSGAANAAYIEANRSAYTNSHPFFTMTNLPVEVTFGDLTVQPGSNDPLALTAQDVVATNQPGTVGKVVRFTRAPTNGESLIVDVPVVIDNYPANGTNPIPPVHVYAQIQIGSNPSLEIQTMLHGIGAGSNSVRSYNAGTNISDAAGNLQYGGYAGNFRAINPSPLRTILDSIPEPVSMGAAAFAAAYLRRRSVKSFGRGR